MKTSFGDRLRNFLSDESGPTAVEYAVMLGMILLVCLGSIAALGLQTQALWETNESDLTTAFNN